MLIYARCSRFSPILKLSIIDDNSINTNNVFNTELFFDVSPEIVVIATDINRVGKKNQKQQKQD